MRRINIDHALLTPTTEALCELLSELCSHGLWKVGSCYEDQLDSRPFSSAQYNQEFFNTAGSMCVAYGITSKANAAALETAGIQHMKYTRRVGVNVKDKDDVPHDGICAARPQALYIVPVQPRFTTQAQFWNEHKSYYKQTLGGAGLMEQREAAGLPIRAPASVPRTGHDGGKQPKRQVHMDDDDFVERLMASGIPLHELDHAFAARSGGGPMSRFNKLLAVFWKVPHVARELSLLFGGKEIADAKFKRIKPMYYRARKSGASSSSAPLPLDATEPRLELELASADNLMAIA